MDVGELLLLLLLDETAARWARMRARREGLGSPLSDRTVDTFAFEVPALPSSDEEVCGFDASPSLDELRSLDLPPSSDEAFGFDVSPSLDELRLLEWPPSSPDGVGRLDSAASSGVLGRFMVPLMSGGVGESEEYASLGLCRIMSSAS